MTSIPGTYIHPRTIKDKPQRALHVLIRTVQKTKRNIHRTINYSCICDAKIFLQNL